MFILNKSEYAFLHGLLKNISSITSIADFLCLRGAWKFLHYHRFICDNPLIFLICERISDVYTFQLVINMGLLLLNQSFLIMTGILTDQVVMLFSTPITLSLVILEIFISVRYDKQYYNVKDTKANLVLGLGYIITDTLSRGTGLFLLAIFYFYGMHPAFFPVILFYTGFYWYC